MKQLIREVNKELKPTKHNLERGVLLISLFCRYIFVQILAISTVGIKNYLRHFFADIIRTCHVKEKGKIRDYMLTSNHKV
jgi:hypothetical protein